MQAYHVSLKEQGTFRPEAIDSNLVLDTDAAVPTIGPGQVLVRMHAVSLNYRDLLVLTSDPIYLPTVEGVVPCADGAGIVAHSNHADWKPGDRVITITSASWKDGDRPGDVDLTTATGSRDVDGTLAQYAAFDADYLVRAPDSLSFEEASTLSIAYGTAWNALYGGQYPLRPGDWIVTQGTGGVSLAALQLAVAAGAKVIGTSSSDSKIEILKKLGATETINYRQTTEWSKRVQEVTGIGAHHVLDVAGPGTIVESIRAIRKGGLVSIIGFLSGTGEHNLIPEILIGAKTLRGIVYTSVAFLKEMVEFVEKHNIKPPIAKTFAWTEAKEAFRLLASSNFTGKIVIKVD